MDAFLATFVMIFLAELGDKTQLIVMAFAAKYCWRQVLAGMTLGIFAVHAPAADSRYGPALTVATSFFVGEMGAKTQFAAMTLAAQWQAWLPVLAGAVLAMVLADGLGLVAGSCLKRFLAPRRMRLLSGVIFLAFGAAGLAQLFAAR